MLVYVVDQPNHDFLVFLVSYSIQFYEVVRKLKKRQWDLSLLMEVSSLTWTENYNVINAVRTDTMSIEGSKINHEKLSEMTN